ncbi:MAG: deaminase [archaeon]
MSNSCKDRPSWNNYFMSIAIDIATRSSCRYIDAGAVVVNDKNRILSTGYNGAPPGDRENCLYNGCRKDQLRIPQETKGKGKCKGTHAEMNALQKAGEDATGATLYTVILPCSHCAKQAASAEIRKIVYAIEYVEKRNGTDETEGDVTRGICRRSGIELEHLAMEEETILQNKRREDVLKNNFRSK